MKKTALVMAVCFVLSIPSKAQCDKDIKWNSSKSEFIDASGNIEQTKEEEAELTAGSKKISLVLKGDHAANMTGDVSDYSCNWKDKQNGKTSFKSVLTDSEGKVRHATITIEAIDGKITALLQAEEESNSIRLTIDSFEEVN